MFKSRLNKVQRTAWTRKPATLQSETVPELPMQPLTSACVTAGTKMSGHKPSERFTRKPLRAKSKASSSERFRVSDLVNKLVENMGSDATENGQTNFNGYRPGPSGPPG